MKHRLIVVCLGLSIVVGVYGLVAWGFQACWNYVVPSVFHGPALTYWQALAGLLLLGFFTSRGYVTKALASR